MLKSVVSYLLQSIIGKYVEDFNRDNVSFGLYSGNLKLENLPLKRDALHDLFDLPINVKSGFLGSVTVQIPYTQLTSQPWIFKIEKIYIVASPKTHDFENFDPEKQKEKKKMQLDGMEEKWLQMLKSEAASSYQGVGAFLLSYGTSLSHSIIQNIQVELRDIHIRYEDDSTVSQLKFACGLRIDNLLTRSTDSAWNIINGVRNKEEAQYKLLDINGVSVYFEKIDSMSEFASVEATSTGFSNINQSLHMEDTQYILEPISFTGYFKRLTTEKELENENNSRLHLDISVDKVVINYSQLQHQIVCALIGEFNRKNKQLSFYTMRPKVPVKGNAKIWWIYAGACLHHEMTRVASHDIVQRCRDVVRYVRSYESYLLQLELPTSEEKQWRNEIETEWTLEELLSVRAIAVDRALTRFKGMKPEDGTTGQDQERTEATFQGSKQVPEGWYSWLRSFVTTVPQQAKLEAEEENTLFDGDAEKSIQEAFSSMDNTEAALQELSIDSEKAKTLMKKDKVFLRFHSVLKTLSITLRTENGMQVFALESTNLVCGCETKPSQSSVVVFASVESLHIREGNVAANIYPTVLTPQSRIQNSPTKERPPLFALCYSLNPQDSSANYKLRMRLEPVHFVYNPSLNDKIQGFFFESKPSEDLKSNALNRYKDLKNRTKRNLRSLLHREDETDNPTTTLSAAAAPTIINESKLANALRPRWDVEMDICAPKIFICDQPFSSKCNVLLLDLGRLGVFTVDGFPHIKHDSFTFDRGWENIGTNLKLKVNNAMECDQDIVSTTKESMMVHEDDEEEEEDDDDEFMTPCGSPVDDLLMTNVAKSQPSLPHIDFASNVYTYRETSEYQNDNFDALPERIYDRFLIRLVDLQVLIGPLTSIRHVINLSAICNPDDFRHSESTDSQWPYSKSRLLQTLQVLDNVTLSVKFWHRLLPGADTFYPRLVLQSSMPKFLLRLSDSKLLLARKCIENIVRISKSHHHSNHPTAEGGRRRGIRTVSSMSRKRSSRTSRCGGENNNTNSFRRCNSTNDNKKVMTANFELEEFIIQLESCGHLLVELRVQKSEANWTHYVRYTEVNLCIRGGLTIADAVANMGPDYDLLVASHDNIKLDSVSGSIHVIDPASPSSNDSQSQRLLDPATLDRSVNSRNENLSSQWLSSELNRSDTNCFIRIQYRRQITMEVKDDLMFRTKAIQSDWNVSFGSLDVIGNQETIIKLIDFFQRVVPNYSQTEDYLASVDHQLQYKRSSSSSSHGTVSNTNVKFSMEHFNLLLINIDRSHNQQPYADKIGALKLLGCCVERNSDENISVLYSFSISSLLVLDLTRNKNSPHASVLSVGELHSSNNCNVWNSSVKGGLDDFICTVDNEAFHLSIFISNLQDSDADSLYEDGDNKNSFIDIRADLSQSIFYTHSPLFLASMSLCVDTIMSNYLSMFLNRVHERAVGQATTLKTSNTTVSVQCELKTPILILPRCTLTDTNRSNPRCGETLICHLGHISFTADDVLNTGASLMFTEGRLFSIDLCANELVKSFLSEDVHSVSFTKLVKMTLLLQNLYRNLGENPSLFHIVEDASFKIEFVKTPAPSQGFLSEANDYWSISFKFNENLQASLSKSVYEQLMASLDNLVYSLPSKSPDAVAVAPVPTTTLPICSNDSTLKELSASIAASSSSQIQLPKSGISLHFFMPGLFVTLFTDMGSTSQPLASLCLQRLTFDLESLSIDKVKRLEMKLQSISLQDLLTHKDASARLQESNNFLLHSSGKNNPVTNDFEKLPEKEKHNSCPSLVFDSYIPLLNLHSTESSSKNIPYQNTEMSSSSFRDYSSSLPEPHKWYLDADVMPSRKRVESFNRSTSTYAAVTMEKQEFVKITATLVDEESPLFHQSYGSTHRFMEILFSNLVCNFNLTSWVLILDFLSLSSRIHDLEFVSQLEDVTRVSQEYAKKPDGQDEKLINSEIFFQVASFSIALHLSDLSGSPAELAHSLHTDSSSSNHSAPFSTVIMKSFNTFLRLRDGNLECDGGLQSIQLLCSGEEVSPGQSHPYQERLISGVDEKPNLLHQQQQLNATIPQFEMHSLTSCVPDLLPHFHQLRHSKAHPTPPHPHHHLLRWYFFKYGMPDPMLRRHEDIRVQLHLAPVYYIHTQFFLQEILLFVHNFTQLMDLVGLARASSAGLKISLTAPRASRIRLQLHARAPILLIPQNFASDRIVVIDLGHLTARNSFCFDDSPTHRDATTAAAAQRQASVDMPGEKVSEFISQSTAPLKTVIHRPELWRFKESDLFHNTRRTASMCSVDDNSSSSHSQWNEVQDESHSTATTRCLLDCMQVTLNHVHVYTAKRCQLGHDSASSTYLSNSIHRGGGVGGNSSFGDPLSGLSFKEEHKLNPIVFSQFTVVPDSTNPLCPPFTIELQLEKNLDSDTNHTVPDWTVRGELSRVHFAIDKDQFQLIKSLLDQNLGADINSIVVKKVQAHPMDPKIQTVLTGKSWCLVNLCINLQNVSIELYEKSLLRSSATLAADNYGQFCVVDFVSSQLSYQSFSDKTKDIRLSCSDVSLVDIRHQSVSKGKNAFPVIVQSKAKHSAVPACEQAELLSLRLQSSETHNSFTFSLNGVRVVIILDWLMQTFHFLSSPCLFDDRIGFSTAPQSHRMTPPHLLNLQINDQEKETIICVSQSEFVFLEAADRVDSNAVIVKSSIGFTHRPNRTEMKCEIKDLEAFSCAVLEEGATTLPIVEPACIQISTYIASTDGKINCNMHGMSFAQGLEDALYSPDGFLKLPILDVSCSRLCVRLSYKDMMLINRLSKSMLVQASTASEGSTSKPIPVSETTANPPSTSKSLTKLLSEKFSLIKINSTKSPFCLSVRVIDDCLDTDVPLVTANFQDMAFIWNFLQNNCGLLHTSLDINFYNRIIASWEPLVEPWSFYFSWKDTGKAGNLLGGHFGFLSLSKFNLNVTPSVVELFSSTFVKWTANMQMKNNPENAPPQSNASASSTTIRAMVNKENSTIPIVEEATSGNKSVKTQFVPFVPFRIWNCTGVPLAFIATTTHTLNGKAQDFLIKKTVQHSPTDWRQSSDNSSHDNFPSDLIEQFTLFSQEAGSASSPNDDDLDWDAHVNCAPPDLLPTQWSSGQNASSSPSSSKWIHVLPLAKTAVLFHDDTVAQDKHQSHSLEHKLKLWIKGWKPVEPSITVDQVGCVFRDLKLSKKTSPDGLDRPNQIIIELCQDKATQKMIVVRSAVQICNELQDRVEMKLDPGHSTPKVIVMDAGETLSLPLPFVYSKVYVRPIGLRLSVNYTTPAMEWMETYKEDSPKEMIYTCKGSSEADHYYICVEMTRKCLPTDNVVFAGHSIILRAPTVIVNLLPYEIICDISTYNVNDNGHSDPFSSMSRQQHPPPIVNSFVLSMGSEKAINYLNVLKTTFVKLAVSDMFTCKEEIRLSSAHISTTLNVPVWDNRQRKVTLQIQVTSRESKARRVVISVPYWIINRCSLPLIFSDRSENFGITEMQEAAGQSEDHEMARFLTPLLFSSSDVNDIPILRVRLGNKYLMRKTGEERERPIWSSNLLLSRCGVDTIQLRMHSRDNRPDLIYNLGVEVRKGRGRYCDTTIVTFRPRFMLENRSQFKLAFTQRHLSLNEESLRSSLSDGIHVGYPQCCLAYHWSRQDLDPLLCTRILNSTNVENTTSKLAADEDSYSSFWSGGFRIDEPSSFFLILRTRGNNFFLRVGVVLQSATFFVVFSDVEGWPLPFRIDNSSPVNVVAYQVEADTISARRSLLRPYSSMNYALDEPILPPIMNVSITGGSSATYNLSSLGTCAPLFYENSFYIQLIIKEGDRRKTTLSHFASFDSFYLDEMVLEVLPDTKRVILSSKVPGRRSQLWWCDPNNTGIIYHEGSCPPRDPSDLSKKIFSKLVLGVNAKCAEPPDSFIKRNLRLERIDSRRSKLQQWCFTKDSQLINRAGMVVQLTTVKELEDVFCSLPPLEMSPRSGGAFSYFFQNWMRPGSGQLAVEIYSDGPVRVMKISDARQINTQLTADRQSAGPHELKSVSAQFHLEIFLSAGIGLSVINHMPEELIYISASDIQADYILSDNNLDKFSLSVMNLQIDNQMTDAAFPIVLHPQSVHMPMTAVDPLEFHSDLQEALDHFNWHIFQSTQSHKEKAFLLFSMKRVLKTKWSAYVFDAFKLQLSNLHIVVEERLLLKLLQLFHMFSSTTTNDKPTTPMEKKPTNLSRHDSHYLNEEEDHLFQTAAAYAEGDFFYFAKMLISTGTIFVSVHKSSSISPDLKQWKKTIPSLMSFVNAPVQLDPFNVQHFSATKRHLLRELESHYLVQLRKQAFLIFGSTDFLGNPLGLYTEIKQGISGLSDLDLPGLFRNVTHGVTDSTAKMIGNVSQVMHVLSLDKAHQEQRALCLEAASKKGGIAHFTAGLTGLREGVMGGISSIFTQPYRGYKEEGVQGLFMGVGKGVVGTVTKPIGGALDFISGTVTSIREVARSSSEGRPPRFRQPRICVANASLRCYDASQAEGQAMVLQIPRSQRTSSPMRRRKSSEYCFNVLQAEEKLRERICIQFGKQEGVDALVTNLSVIFVRRHGKFPSNSSSESVPSVFVIIEIPYHQIRSTGWCCQTKHDNINWYVFFNIWKTHSSRVPQMTAESSGPKMRCESETIAKELAFAVYEAWCEYKEAELTFTWH